jgi:hypothetical protein
MTWRIAQNLCQGELDNRVPGRISGWLSLYRPEQANLNVHLRLDGDFAEDIRGALVKLSNPAPFDRHAMLPRARPYLTGFHPLQLGRIGIATAGLRLGAWTDARAERALAIYEARFDLVLSSAGRERRRQELALSLLQRVARQKPYYVAGPRPRFEWFSTANERCELLAPRVEILDRVPVREKSVQELAFDELWRDQLFDAHVRALVSTFYHRKRGARTAVLMLG